MTTTLPDPVTGTDAGTSAGLRAEADRLTAMPRSWAPSVSELLDEETRRLDTGGQDTGGHDTEPPQSSTVRPTLADLDRVLDQLAANDTHVATLHAQRAVLLAQAAGLAEALETDPIDPDDPTARHAPSARRLELAHRAVLAEIATTLHLGEHATSTLTDHAHTLTNKAPATLQALSEGRLTWAHATAITGHLADLTPEEAAAVERSVLGTVLDHDTGLVRCTPTQTARRTRRARETNHPVPTDVRHTEAAQHRAVYLDEGRDGMAWLVAHLPAPLAHAAHDRLTRSGRHLIADGDPRTMAQARADVLAALLLDDGSLDARTPDAGTPDAGSPDLSATERGAETATDGDGPPEVHLHDRPPLATLARSIRPQVTVTVPVLTLLGITDAPATLNGHVPVDPGTARQLTALAPSLRRILTDPESGAVLSVGRTTYAIPADLKALVRERDTTCRFPGCTHPAQQSDLDHTTAWADGGTTDATNLAALCRRHHVLKHQTTWQVRQAGTVGPTPSDIGAATGWDGTLEWTSPTGRRHTTTPDPVDTTRHRVMPTGHDPGHGAEAAGIDDAQPPFRPDPPR